MTEFTLQPTVDQTQEFIEIANDFANPLDLVREAISNSFDARASTIRLSFETEDDLGEKLQARERIWTDCKPWAFASENASFWDS